jgi:carbon-monoxide dehydrogenase medium subunit
LRDTLKDSKQPSPQFLISLHKINKLKGINKLNGGDLNIGALTTITEIERSDVIRGDWTALAEGADSLGSPLVRNRGTLGGNIANARPAADTVIPTIALCGKLTLTGTSGTRTVHAEDFPKGPGITIIKQDEILTNVNYPAPLPYSGSAYYKLANRKALEISTVGVAVWVALEKSDGPVKDVRIALGAVGPTPILAESVKDILIGEIPSTKVIREAAKSAAGDAIPIDDHRGSAAYRLQSVEVLTERLLKIALNRAGRSE